MVVAGDAGSVPESAEARPSVQRLLAGETPLSATARAAGATVRVVDIALADDLPTAPAETTRHKLRRGSGRIAVEDAMPAAETHRALAAGAAIADEEVDAGADLLVIGALGAGLAVAAATLIAALTDTEPVAVVDRHGGDDADWVRRMGEVRDALRRVRALGAAADPASVLGYCGGPVLGALAGLVSRAAQRRTPVVLDGLATCAAALLAERRTPGAVSWCLAGSRSPEPAQAVALTRLGLTPLLDLALRLDDGTGALLALPLLAAAAAMSGSA